MSRHVLIVHAHPEPTSLTRQMADAAEQALREDGHTVSRSDLHAMGWKAVVDADDFPSRVDAERLSVVAESGHSYATGQLTEDVAVEHRKLLAADLVILQFPLWWFGMPAILKGWIDRVWSYGLAYGHQGAGNRYRYGEGGLSGRRALVSITTGGPASDYSPRGINGELDELLFPITHGMLFYPGMSVLRTHAVFGTSRFDAAQVEAAKHAWRERLAGIFEESPIAYRAQNGGDYPDHHVLAETLAPGQHGLRVHQL